MGQQSPWIDKAQALPPFSIPVYLTSYTSTDEFPQGLWFRLMCVKHESEAKLMGTALWLAYAHHESIWENHPSTGKEAWEVILQCERDFKSDGLVILQHFADKFRHVGADQYDRIVDYIWDIGGDCDDALHLTETLDSLYVPFTR